MLKQMMHNVPLCSDIMLLYVKGIIEKAREFQKNIYCCCIGYFKVFDYGSQQTVESSSRDGNTRPPYLPSWKICMLVKEQQLELDMEQWTGSKWERSMSRLYIVTLLI